MNNERLEDNKLVSVVIPVFNVEKYLRECLDSVIQQSYSNLDIIIVDDGTKDNSGKIADEYEKIDPRIRVVHKENKGVASARNVGIELAKGEFIVFIDSDDWVSTDYVDYLMYLQKVSDSDMCFTSEFFTQKTDFQVKKESVKTITAEEAATMLLSPYVVVGTYNKIYRLSWLKEKNIKQNEELFSGEGLHFIVLAAQNANHVTISNKKIYYYRRNVAESATTKFNINMFLNNEYSLELIEKSSIVNGEKYRTMLELFKTNLMMSGMEAIINNRSMRECRIQYKNWKSNVKRASKEMLSSREVPMRFKIRIVGVLIAPHLWAFMSKCKRKMIFNGSV